MEEDIKILEFLKDSEIEFPLQRVRKPMFSERQKQAIENLIKGYRELEKDLHEMTISNNHKKENWIHRNCLNDSIPKSKIKEKIEELEKEHKEYIQEWEIKDEIQAQIDVLQELMEDK